MPERTSRRTPKSALVWILGLGLALRVALLFWWEPVIAGDAQDYLRIAEDLTQGRGFVDTNGDPSSFRAPIYPLALAAVFRVFGSSVLVIRVLQSLVDLLTLVVVYRVADRTFGVHLGRWVAPLAAGLVAINLGQITASQRILSETLFTLLFVAAVGASSEWWRSEKPAASMQWGVATGFLFGLAALTRGVMIAYPPALVLVAWGSRGRARRGSVALLLSFALTLAPWTLRNYVAHGFFVPVSTQIGITLYASYNPPGGSFGFNPTDSVVARANRLPEAEASRELTKAAIETALASPKRTLRLEGLKTLYFWSPVDWELLPTYGAMNPTYMWIVLMALAGLGASGGRRAFARHWPVLLPVAYLFFMALVFHGSPRYRLPAEPLLAIAAAATVIGLSSKLGRRAVIGLAVSLALICGAASIYSETLRAVLRPWMSGS